MARPEPTRILIVDDHAVVREGTRELLARDPALRVVGETGSGGDAVRLAVALRPDVVLLDLALPDLHGLEVARQLRALTPAARVVVLSAYDDEEYVLAALEAGAAAYLLKTVRGQEVIDTIRAVEEGQVVLHPAIAARLRQAVRPAAGAGADPTLSAREREILRLAAQGLHNKEIASALALSVRTVEGHLSHILTKLGVSSRTEAVLYGVAQHWFPIGERP
jgi:DNA-binding NarL/FixJ family response regulator